MYKNKQWRTKDRPLWDTRRNITGKRSTVITNNILFPICEIALEPFEWKTPYPKKSRVITPCDLFSSFLHFHYLFGSYIYLHIAILTPQLFIITDLVMNVYPQLKKRDFHIGIWSPLRSRPILRHWICCYEAITYVNKPAICS